MKPSKTSTLQNTLTLVLAGGQGERLSPLTRNRSKPSVSFGGVYRIIDFTLSNCLNSGLRRIYVLTQYQSLTLDQHIKHGWDIFSIDIDEFIYSLPPQHQVTQRWYLGTADAVYQNVYLFNIHRPEKVIIVSGDHIYKMDYYEMLKFHEDKGSDVTVAAVVVEVEDAKRYGVLQIDENSRIIGFQEKPESPKSIPGRPGQVLCNMGVYVFNTDALVRAVMKDTKSRVSSHDFGRDVLPALVKDRANVFAFDFKTSGQAGYWRDIGTLESFYEANMNLLNVNPPFDLYDTEWPVRSYQRQFPPVKSVVSPGPDGDVQGLVTNSLVSPGCIISGGRVSRSVLSYGVRIKARATVSESILMDNVSVESDAKLRRCILDEGVRIPEGTEIGFDAESDRRQFTVSESGIVVVPSGYQLDEPQVSEKSAPR